MSVSFQFFYKAFIKLLLVYLIGVFILMTFRTALLIIFGNFSELSDYKLDIVLAYWVGFRFDTCVMTYALLPGILLIIAMAFLPSKSASLYKTYNKFLLPYCLFVLFVFVLLLIIDFFFFKFFQSHINTLFFGIIYDDTKAVMDSVWLDYPVIRIFLLMSLIIYLLSVLIKKIIRTEFNSPQIKRGWQIVSLILLFPIYFLAMRGSVGTFPLETDDTSISTNTFVNGLTMNGVFSLKEAFVQRNKQLIDTNIPKMLGTYGFSDPAQAIAAYLDTTVTNQNDLKKYLLSKTPTDTFLQKNPPNVVFIQMESMSNYYLDLHSKEMNLLGSLESQLPYCYLFRNFLSCANGTIHTLEGIMVNSPMTPLAQSSYVSAAMKSSVAYPFKQRGYRTHYITGAKLGWRNFDKFIPNKYFDNWEGNITLLEKVNGSQASEWGTYDEYLFERIYNVLDQGNDKPQFIYAMTTTNHTPYDLPETYKPKLINFSKALEKDFRVTADIALKNFTNYQYANDCLGRFIEKVRKSPLGKNTIIVASGDHNTWQVFDFTDTYMLQKYSVPLLMFLPDAYKPAHIIDTARFGSHKDIFPTIFNRALSDVSYLKSGNDLLGKNNDEYFFAVNGYCIAMNKYGCVFLTDTPLYFRWKKENSKTLEPCTIEEVPELTVLINKLKAHVASLKYNIQVELMSQ